MAARGQDEQAEQPSNWGDVYLAIIQLTQDPNDQNSLDLYRDIIYSLRVLHCYLSITDHIARVDRARKPTDIVESMDDRFELEQLRSRIDFARRLTFTTPDFQLGHLALFLRTLANLEGFTQNDSAFLLNLSLRKDNMQELNRYLQEDVIPAYLQSFGLLEESINEKIQQCSKGWGYYWRHTKSLTSTALSWALNKATFKPIAEIYAAHWSSEIASAYRNLGPRTKQSIVRTSVTLGGTIGASFTFFSVVAPTIKALMTYGGSIRQVTQNLLINAASAAKLPLVTTIGPWLHNKLRWRGQIDRENATFTPTYTCLPNQQVMTISSLLVFYTALGWWNGGRYDDLVKLGVAFTFKHVIVFLGSTISPNITSMPRTTKQLMYTTSLGIASFMLGSTVGSVACETYSKVMMRNMGVQMLGQADVDFCAVTPHYLTLFAMTLKDHLNPVRFAKETFQLIKFWEPKWEMPKTYQLLGVDLETGTGLFNVVASPSDHLPVGNNPAALFVDPQYCQASAQANNFQCNANNLDPLKADFDCHVGGDLLADQRFILFSCSGRYIPSGPTFENNLLEAGPEQPTCSWDDAPQYANVSTSTPKP